MAAAEYQMFEENFWSENGFDELRRLMKQGSDFVKEIMSVLHERSEMEKKYSNSLLALAKKAKKANSYCMGSVNEAWNRFIESVEGEADMHKNHAQELQLQCFSPLKDFLDNRIRQRKPLEQAVDRNKKVFHDKCNDQIKFKKVAYTKCRELEQTLEQLEVLKRRGGGTEKEMTKLEKNSKKNEEALIKAERDYKESNVKTEESRLTWESSMYRCCRHLENLEHTRLEQVSEVLRNYSQLLMMNQVPLQETSDGLNEVASVISADRDIEVMCQHSGTGPNVPEQILLDVYEEDAKNNMNEDRRAASLDKKIQELEGDIDRKEKEKRGVQSLSAAYEKTPDFVDEQGAADVNRQIIDANSMLNLLKANHFKLLKARTGHSNLPSPDSPYLQFMKNKQDKLGFPLTVLSVTIDQVSELEEQATLDQGGWKPPPTSSSLTASTNNNAAARVSSGSGYDYIQDQPPPSYDEFDDLPPDQNQDQGEGGGQEYQDDYTYISRCEVLYDYDSVQADELTIVPGQTIYVTEKLDADWWRGNLDGTVGLFPASYVEEVELYDS